MRRSPSCGSGRQSWKRSPLGSLLTPPNPLLPPPLQAELAAQLRDNKVRGALSRAEGGTALTLRGLSLQPQVGRYREI